MQQTCARRVLRFGVFDVNLSARELRKHGTRIRLPGQPFAILVMLLEKPGEVLTREDMRQKLWSSDTFVDFEHSLNSAIKKLRAALGDSPENSRYIETIPRVGYRFIAPVQEVSADGQPVASSVIAAVTEADSPAISDPPPRKAWRKNVLAVAVLVAMAAVGIGFRRLKSLRAPPDLMTERQLTYNPPENRTFGSAISPDGKVLAFGDTRGLHLTTIGSAEVHDVALPEQASDLWEVAWFPDGQKLLVTTFFRTEGQGIWLVSIFGGTPRKMWSASYAPVVSPQGSAIAYVSGAGHEIWISGANGENPRKLKENKDAEYCGLAWSPTGERIAYLMATSEVRSVETVPFVGGTSRPVISDSRLPGGELPGGEPASSLVWLRDGRLVLILEEPDNTFGNLFQIRVDPSDGAVSGGLRRITNWHGEGTLWPSASIDGTRLVVVKWRYWQDVYLAHLLEKGATEASTSRLTLSRSFDIPGGWTHDGTSVLFQSNRTGRNEIYRQKLSQEDAEPLIPGSDDQSSPQLSPDGTWILYWSTPHDASSRSSTKQLMRFHASSGSPEKVLDFANDDAIVFDCPYSPSASCVLSQPDHGELNFYQLDAIHGIGRRVGTTNKKASSPWDWAISTDGSRIVVTNDAKVPGQVRIMNLAESTQRTLAVSPEWHIGGVAWAEDANSLFVVAKHIEESFILRIALDGKVSVVSAQGKNHRLDALYASPDGRKLAFSQTTWESNAWLLQNF